MAGFVTWMSVPLSAYAWLWAVLSSFFIFDSMNMALWFVGGLSSGMCRASGRRKDLLGCSKECVMSVRLLFFFALLVCGALSLRKSIVVLLYLFCLVTTCAAMDIGRRDAENAFVVTSASPLVSSIGDVLPLP